MLKKKFIKLFLISILIFVSLIVYKFYFFNENINNVTIENELKKLNEENLIKNLKYETKIGNNHNYRVYSEYGNIFYENGLELVDMKNVEATFVGKDNLPIIISSENALFNSSSFETNFSNNVKIIYLENLIQANNLNFYFKERKIKIFGNVNYEGLNSKMNTDYIIIDLISKKINLYMDKKNQNIIVETVSD